MNCKISTTIRNRKEPNNVFITPLPLAKTAIDMIDILPNEIWYDPFKNSGNYYNQFPTENKLYSEILEGKDFFEFNEKVDVICSNPPYSMLDDIIQKSISLDPRVINYLVGIVNLTPRRIEFLNKAGYGLTKFHLCKVFKWFSMSIIIQFEKGKTNVISFDRIVWR